MNKKKSAPKKATATKLPYVIIRSASSGVHAGYLKRRDGDEVDLIDATRIWYWSGAASLSELAMVGAKNPEQCKFAVMLPNITVLGVCEVIPCAEEAKKMIQSCPVWRA
jgi:hypothetical protein